MDRIVGVRCELHSMERDLRETVEISPFYGQLCLPATHNSPKMQLVQHQIIVSLN